MGDEAIHQGHCTRAHCAYGDPQCPVNLGEFPGGRAQIALSMLAEDAHLSPWPEEYAVRNRVDGWVYALPRKLPKFLDGKRGTLECAQWHRRQLGGPDPEDNWVGFEIVRRPVGPWEVVA